MKVGIIGLGLIGGSMAKTIKVRTGHTVLGRDRSPQVVQRARLIGAIDGELTDEALPSCDMVLLALYPDDIVATLEALAPRFGSQAVVIDCGGIKTEICRHGRALAKRHGWTFIGGHPMAGIEKSGFAAARQTLFAKASMILAPDRRHIDLETLARVKRFFLDLGFGSIKITTPEEHDRVIAYTSQLAHVLSSAYIKSPTALDHVGFSAGSFRDMTRVATLVPEMWAQLFLQNRGPLLQEIDGLVAHLQAYRDALAAGDRVRLETLLAEGRDMKERSNALEAAAEKP